MGTFRARLRQAVKWTSAVQSVLCVGCAFVVRDNVMPAPFVGILYAGFVQWPLIVPVVIVLAFRRAWASVVGVLGMGVVLTVVGVALLAMAVDR